MNFVVIGTDHRAQTSDCGLEALVRALLNRSHFDPLVAIAEEWHEENGQSICQGLADEHGLRWYNPDMTTEEQRAAGILDEQKARRRLGGAFRVPSDEVRETAWVNKLSQSGEGTTFVICGYLHFESLVAKLRAKGHGIDTRVYLGVVPEITSLSSEELKKKTAQDDGAHGPAFSEHDPSPRSKCDTPRGV